MIAIETLINFGLKEVQPRFFENDFSYDWHRITKNNSKLDITTEYDANGKRTKQYAEFNGKVLEGCLITKFHLEFLIKLM